MSLPREIPGEKLVRVPAGTVELEGSLGLAPGAVGLVLFAHGSGSSRLSPRNQQVARALRASGLATLLCDLLTDEEAARDVLTGRLRFDIGLLTDRVVAVVDWVAAQPDTRALPIGCFGASTGAAAALAAAAERPDLVRAIVSRGGRPDLAIPSLPRVQAPTLLIVGGQDELVLNLNREARLQMRAETDLVIVPGATHLFEEPGALDQVAHLAAAWFGHHLHAIGQPHRHAA